MTSPNQQHPFPSRKSWTDMARSWTRTVNIWFSKTKCIHSDYRILGLSVQALVSHILTLSSQTATIKRWAKYLKSSHSCYYWSHAMEKHRNVSDTVREHNFSLQGQIICLALRHWAITATQTMQVGQSEASSHLFCFPSLNSSWDIHSATSSETEECVQQLQM